ncbi:MULTISPECIES: hypothetical protein [Gammaproteobacteria]|uniref:hypothetical protein n=1 Tax=Gammaproteobacteria TaxID=1236 RepID=UPI00059F4855|nr:MULTISPECIES: hypothetical protein [Gammaproteobacteria]MCO7241196.1 hypothetical protein [Halomonas sp. Ps84H-12]
MSRQHPGWPEGRQSSNRTRRLPDLSERPAARIVRKHRCDAAPEGCVLRYTRGIGVHGAQWMLPGEHGVDQGRCGRKAVCSAIPGV